MTAGFEGGDTVHGVVLAGGASTRFADGDKPLAEVERRPCGDLEVTGSHRSVGPLD